MNDATKIGSKAKNLQILTENGFFIPAFITIDTSFFHRYFEKKQFDLRAKLDLINFSGPYAVRSSSPLEDQEKISGAGQFASLLNVAEDDLIFSIEQCWESAFSDRAKAYFSVEMIQRQGLAVVVQKMIEPKYAGVIFTKEPVSNSRESYVLELIEGLGVGLVDGTVTPTMYRLDSVNGQTQDHEGQLELKNDLLSEIFQQAKKIKQVFKSDQDIEWAVDNKNKLWILQARSITT